jgi:hypothetical protein
MTTRAQVTLGTLLVCLLPLAGSRSSYATQALVAQGPGGFSQETGFSHFTDRTMRVDYFHTSKAGERIVTLDRVVDDGPWAGSRTRLLDDTNLGAYLFEVIDRATNRPIYSRGFATLYGEWETTPEAAIDWQTYHDSLRFPWPRMPVQVVVKRRGDDQLFREIWTTAIDPGSRFVNRAPLAPQGRLITILESGSPADKVDVLLLGEGYTEAEGTKFEAAVRRLVDALFRHEPFRSRQSDFNVRALHLPSAESGVHRPQANVHRRTPAGTEYNIFDSERYMLSRDNRAMRDAVSAVPYEFLEIVVNDDYYGGGGIFGSHATVAAGNAFAEYLFIHEFAHHFAALADEYYTSDVAYATGGASRPEPWMPNVTALHDHAAIKWADLVTPGTPLPTPWPKEAFEAAQREYQQTRRTLRASGAPEAEMTRLFTTQKTRETALLSKASHAGRVGAFEGANYEATGFYRPEIDCVMFSRNEVPFCRVCQRAIARVIDLYARP